MLIKYANNFLSIFIVQLSMNLDKSEKLKLATLESVNMRDGRVSFLTTLRQI